MTDRIRLIDALRGLSLAGIAVAHFGEQYLGFVPPPEHQSYAIHGTLDGLFEALSWIFVRGKGLWTVAEFVATADWAGRFCELLPRMAAQAPT